MNELDADRAEAQRAFEEREAFVMAEENWFVLRVMQGAPIRVEQVITERLHVTAYCPRFTMHRRARYGHGARGETHEITKPLFPGYLFTRSIFDVARIAPAKTAFLTVETTRGRKHLAITAAEMTQIRQAEEIASREPQHWVPKVGDTVRALRGLLTATIAEIKRKRARIEVNGRSLYVSVDELEFVARALARDSKRDISRLGCAA